MRRGAGILLPLSSLPSPYGIGSLGKEAYAFVDFLEQAKQRYWQILPIGPTGYGDSPYQSFSAFAASPYYIDLLTLQKEGLLTRKELSETDFGDVPNSIDYYKLYLNRKPLLEKAVARFSAQDEAFVQFKQEQEHWLYEYALFMALKGENDMKAFSLWDEDIRLRQPWALEDAKVRLGAEIHFWQVVQFWFYSQWYKLKAYANERGISIIGDIPIYVSPDSAELWAWPHLFQVDENSRPTEVAGCPPDAFSQDGQLWGNPLYEWEHHKNEGYAWWKRRIRHACTVFDVVRIDHFRGFSGYYAIPANAETAKEGRWRDGPRAEFIDSIKADIPDMCIIAEDLGYLTEDVHELLRHSGFPGTKVLQFAFDSREDSDYLPHNYTFNSVVYTGTHDNTTTEDWKKSAPKEDVAFCKRYLEIIPGRDFTRTCVRAALGSVSDLCIIPMADWLNLGIEARINTPSTLGGNWLWRVQKEELGKRLANELAALTAMYGRNK